MNIESVTTVQGQPMTLVGVPQQLHALTVEVYRRRWAGEISQAGQDDFGWSQFRTDVQASGIVWDGHRLLIETAGRFHPLPVHLDLLWNARGKLWTGAFRRGGIAEQVTLERPAPQGKASPFAGTWKASFSGCVHIAEAADGTFSMWADQIRVPGLERYAPHLQRPSVVSEFYGWFGMAALLDRQTLQLNFHPFAAGVAGGQLVPTFVRPGPGGTSLIEAGESSLAQRTWARQPHGTCIR